MKHKYHIMIALFVLLFSLSAIGDDLEFKHSGKAKVLGGQYATEVAKAEQLQATQLEKLNDDTEAKRQQLLATLIFDLKIIQGEETKVGNLDAALEIREKIEILTSPTAPPAAKITPMQLREKLSNTTWLHEAGKAANNQFRFNDDGTVTAGWHTKFGMWAVLPDLTVQAMVMDNRSLTRIVMDPSLKAAKTVSGKWTFRRVK